MRNPISITYTQYNILSFIADNPLITIILLTLIKLKRFIDVQTP